MKYGLKMIYFTLNGVEIKFGRVGKVSNRSEIGFPSRISHWSQLSRQSRGEFCARICHVALLGAAACASRSWAEARVVGSSASFQVAVAGLD